MTTVLLGHVGARPRTVDDPRRRLLAVSTGDAIVLVGTRLPGAWACHVVARRRPDSRPRRVVLTDAEIDEAVAAVDTDRDRDPDGYAMVWVARVHATLPAENIPPVARMMAEHLRHPGSLLVDVDHRALSRLAVAARRRDRLHMIVQRLAEHGLLAAETPAENVRARYRLVIPTGDSSDPRLRLPRQLSSSAGRRPAHVTT